MHSQCRRKSTAGRIESTCGKLSAKALAVHEREQGCFGGMTCSRRSSGVSTCSGLSELLASEFSYSADVEISLVAMTVMDLQVDFSTPHKVDCFEQRQLSQTADQAAAARLECPSLGSAGHYLGRCMPCPFKNGPRGCAFGAECKRCHLHKPSRPNRRNRVKQAAFPRIVN